MYIHGHTPAVPRGRVARAREEPRTPERSPRPCTAAPAILLSGVRASCAPFIRAISKSSISFLLVLLSAERKGKGVREKPFWEIRGQSLAILDQRPNYRISPPRSAVIQRDTCCLSSTGRGVPPDCDRKVLMRFLRDFASRSIALLSRRLVRGAPRDRADMTRRNDERWSWWYRDERRLRVALNSSVHLCG